MGAIWKIITNWYERQNGEDVFVIFQIVLLIIVNTVLLLLFTGLLVQTLYYLLILGVIWIPFCLAKAFGAYWLRFIRHKFIVKQGSVLLEVRLPKEILKSPQAFEIALNSFYLKGSPTYLETYWKGKVRTYISFEIVSIGGQVKFYIWVPPKYRPLVEAQLYAQYPGLEITEAAEDYAYAFKNDREKEQMWSTYFKLKKDSLFPIRTYVDLELDSNPKEEHKIDPLVQLLEFMGTMKKGEQLWYQIIIQAHKTEALKEGYLFERKTWDKRLPETLGKLLARDPKKRTSEENDEGVPQRVTLSDIEKDVAKSMDRNVSKTPFEVCIRALYAADNDAVQSSTLSTIPNSMNQYNSKTGYNEFNLGAFTDFDYPWQDFRRIRRNRREDIFLDMYRRRAFFQYPYKHYLCSPFIMSTESIATIFHFPGQTAATPTVDRIQSKKSEPPSNLPI